MVQTLLGPKPLDTTGQLSRFRKLKLVNCAPIMVPILGLPEVGFFARLRALPRARSAGMAVFHCSPLLNQPMRASCSPP
jgi:hypothetical protein